jgi:SAM-dependent methyltransferase
MARMQAVRRSLVLSALAWGLPAWSQPVYEAVRPSQDGIGKRYLGREISGVMGWQGAAWLERQGREREERADLLLRELRLSAGMGFYSRRIAPLVAPGGTVFAVDVQPQMLRLLESQARESGLQNIRPVLASVRGTGLAPGSVDLALLVDVYHELEYPFEVMQDVVRALRPGGRVVLVEYRAEDPAVPIKPLHKMSQAQVKKEMAPHPLVHESTADILPWQHVMVFRRA